MKRFVACGIALFIILSCSSGVWAKKRETVRIMGGSNIPRYGLAIDASYDKRFDNFIEGYKIVQVAIVNNSFNMIAMDPQRDRWTVYTSEGKKRYRAIPDLQRKDPRAWNELPKKVRTIIAYPLVLPIGARQVIDLFVPASAPLETLQKIGMDIKSMDAKFEIAVRN